MRFPRIALGALLSFAVLACSEEAPDADGIEQQTEAATETADTSPPPPPSSWGEDDFSDDNDSSDPSFSDEGATSAEGLK